MSVADQSPDEQQKLAEVSSEIADAVSRARGIEVTTDAQAQDATVFLAEIKSARDRSERARRFLVDPLNAHVKAINDRIKSSIVPLDEADQLVRRKVLTYQAEQERRRREEQERLERQRRLEEAAAADERRRTEAIAKRAEEKAEAIERERQVQLAAQKSKRRQQIAAMSDDELKDLARNGTPEDMRVAFEEKDARAQARKAQARAANARREAEEATQRSIAVQAAPAPAAADLAKLTGEAGSAAVRHEWRGTIVDPTRLPRKYLQPDTKAINAAIREGVREIPGMRIEQVSGLAVRANG